MISKELISLIQHSRRPIFVWGSGLRPYANAARNLACSMGIPVACTWGAIDLIHYDDPLMAGGFGTHGTRAANFAVQNADLVISIGSRLDTKATGFPKHFARDASLVMVDIDPAEIQKFSKLDRKIDIGIEADAGKFIKTLSNAELFHEVPLQWGYQIEQWRKRYDTPAVPWGGINPYEFVKELGKYTTKDDIICSDTGCALGWMMQAFPFKGERFLHAFNMTPMGYGLAAAIGASFATGQRIILVSGDGSLMMSLAELATVARWNLNIKIILFNNQGHAMCRQTQRQWLGGESYPATSVEGGLGFPNSFEEMALDFGFQTTGGFKGLFLTDRATFWEVPIHPDAHLIPQARFGAPIEDQEPLLPRDEFHKQMIVEPIS